MFENIMNFFKKLNKKETKVASNSKEAAKERLHLVLMQDRANVSADFLELMKQEIIEVIKKYIDVDESAIDVRLTNKENGDGTNGAPALYANIPILNIKNEARKVDAKTVTTEEKKSDKKTVEKENKKDKKDNNIENKQEEEKIEEDKSKKNNSETEEATDLNVDVKTEKTEEKIKKRRMEFVNCCNNLMYNRVSCIIFCNSVNRLWWI